MKVFHNTRRTAAEAIMSGGFIDAEGSHMTTNVYRGVWVSNVPLDINEGADGDTLLSFELDESVFREYEWVEDEKPYRESLIPAEILNQYGTPEIVGEEEMEALSMARFPTREYDDDFR